MYTVEVVVRNILTGDVRSFTRRVDPLGFEIANWDRAFPAAQQAVQELQAAEPAKVDEFPIL